MGRGQSTETASPPGSRTCCVAPLQRNAVLCMIHRNGFMQNEDSSRSILICPAITFPNIPSRCPEASLTPAAEGVRRLFNCFVQIGS